LDNHPKLNLNPFSCPNTLKTNDRAGVTKFLQIPIAPLSPGKTALAGSKMAASAQVFRSDTRKVEYP
jgi:hypothetical protein